MSDQWYYVEGNERVGPVEKSEIEALLQRGDLNEDSYIWTKGFSNWEYVKNVSEFSPENIEADDIEIESIPEITSKSVSFDNVDENKKLFHIKIGHDRGVEEMEYGPYSLKQLRRAYNENRINDKTYIFSSQMDSWQLIGDSNFFELIAGESKVPVVEDGDRRKAVRRPFVARLYFHDSTEVFQGICRDISIGGLQILVSDFPGKVGDSINMNVHPENTDYNFTARGEVVRLLPGGQGLSVRFVDLKENSANAIEKYLSY